MPEPVRSAVVFDIETFAKPVGEQDATTLNALTKYCKNDEEKEQALKLLGLNAITGEVACIALFDLKRQRPAIFYRQDIGEVTAADSVTWNNETIPVNLQPHANERELLTAVWRALDHFDALITFNGRTFDCPFLMQRALILDVPAIKHLFTNRYNTQRHLDLCDYLTGFGVTRRLSLDLLTRACGITSPKEAGIDGAMVAELLQAGNMQDVANYCMRDVIATSMLAKRTVRVFAGDLRGFVNI